LERIDQFVAVKRKQHDSYTAQLSGVSGISLLKEPPYSKSNYWLHTLLISPEYGRTRDELMQLLGDQRIESRPLWQLNHLQKPYRKCRAYRIKNAVMLYRQLLNIPSSVGLAPEDLTLVATVIQGGQNAAQDRESRKAA
jgi:perosamine synthetase